MENPIQVLNEGFSSQAVVYINTMRCIWVSDLKRLAEREKNYDMYTGLWGISAHSALADQVDPTKYIERDELEMLILLGEYDD